MRSEGTEARDRTVADQQLEPGNRGRMVVTTSTNRGVIAMGASGAVWRRSALVGLLGATFAVAMFGFSASASADVWQWGQSYSLPADSAPGWPVSCQTTSLCVTTGQVGMEDVVYWSTDPAAGASSWHYTALEPVDQSGDNAPLTDVSCTADLCALSDEFGNIWVSGNPTGPAIDWGKTNLDQSAGLLALSCWSIYCAEMDALGNALVTNPAPTLSETSLFDSGGLGFDIGQLSISCNASAFCAATDEHQTLAWTTSETSSAPGWQTGNLSGVNDIDQIACPTSSLCVAAENTMGGDPAVGVSTNPGGGVGTWNSETLPSGFSPNGLGCQSGVCVLGGYGEVLTSTNPAGGISTWVGSRVPGSAFIGGISCPSATECVAEGSSGISVGLLVPGTGGGGTSGGNGTATVGHASVKGTVASVPVSCTGPAGAKCVITGALSATETLKGGKVIAVVAGKKKTKKLVHLGKTTVTLTAGHHLTLTIALNAAGKRLLKAHHKLRVKLTVTSFASGKTKALASKTVTFKAKHGKP